MSWEIVYGENVGFIRLEVGLVIDWSIVLLFFIGFLSEWRSLNLFGSVKWFLSEWLIGIFLFVLFG